MKAIQLFSLLIPILLISCGDKEAPAELEKNPVKLNAPVLLDYGQSIIYLDDYVFRGETIDNVSILGQKQDFSPNERIITFQPPENAPRLMLMEIWVAGQSQAVLLKRSGMEKVKLTFDPEGKSYESVKAKGEFNGWTPDRTVFGLKNGIWEAELLLNEGKYQYQLLLDGKAQLDPANPLVVGNNMGGQNSQLIVGDPDRSGAPKLLTESQKEGNILISIENGPAEVIALWDNQLIEGLSIKDSEVVISIPKEAKNRQRSHIRVFAWNAKGLSNDILIPLEKGNVVEDPQLFRRTDHHANIMYNVFVDRFVNGDSANDKHLPDSIVLPKANYMGGDIMGIEEIVRDGYFESLNVNALWISPVVKNTDGAFGLWPEPRTKFSAYHGYWPTSFTSIDSHFGKKDELKQLVTTMHAEDMNILLDVIANHVHKEHPFYIANPDKVTQLELPDGTLNLERWDEYRLTTWFDVFLPSLDLEDEGVAETVSDSLLWWALEYDVDGYRHDAAKHVPLSFWRLLTAKVNRQVLAQDNKSFYQLGETYGSVQLINSYIGKGLLDAQFDFNVYDAAIATFAGNQPFDLLADRLKESLRYYGNHNLMCYITGNQDRGRFISYAGGDLKFDEDAKAAGWTREIGVGNPIGYKKLQMLMAFNMSIPGIPVIYYGDEFGMPGGNDPDCRRMMRFGDELNEREKQNLEVTQKLTKIRKENLALTYGDLLFLEARGNVLVLGRKYFGNTVLVAFNNSEAPFLFNPSEYLGYEIQGLEKHFNSIASAEGKAYEVPAYDFEIWSIKE